MVLPFPVIFEDNHLLVVNKPAGILVQGDRSGDESVLDVCKAYIKNKYGKPGEVYLGLPHRLDRPVSGVVVLARTSKALERVTKAFREKQVEKIYWAITSIAPPLMEDRLVHWLIKDHRKNLVFSYNKSKTGSVKAELDYKIIARVADQHLLEIKLITGRFHQIRVQLKSIGCPVVGDVKYGYKVPNPDGSICLHARALKIMHPVKKEWMILKADLPSKLWENFISFGH